VYTPTNFSAWRQHNQQKIEEESTVHPRGHLEVEKPVSDGQTKLKSWVDSFSMGWMSPDTSIEGKSARGSRQSPFNTQERRTVSQIRTRTKTDRTQTEREARDGASTETTNLEHVQFRTVKATRPHEGGKERVRHPPS